MKSKANFRFARAFVVAAVGVVLATGCTPRSNSSRSLLESIEDLSGIFSTRPQTATHTVLLLKLKQRPLLSALKLVAGKKTIDAELAKSIKSEQETLITNLNEISPEIRVLYRYRLVVNGVAIVAPISAVEKLRALANVAYVETSGHFSRPVLADVASGAQASSLNQHNSVKFIGADQAHAKGIRGQGMKVGIIDTGIDYTHAMFGGAGTVEAYKAVEPSKDNPGFPTAKVVGGIDLVGTDYDSDSADFKRRVPIADTNPLDEAGHGSHVAGTVAGLGDGVNTYDGVAPDASLYAIKVFGANGSTGDAVVVAGLEYAADPNGDGDLSDQLNVVNLSLGSPYGNPHILYSEAMKNLTLGGTSVVASAGNSGDNDYIVGAPSVAEDVLSVAASVDDMDQNYKFAAVRFATAGGEPFLVEAIEGTISKPLSEITDVTGPLVFVGLADKDLSDDVKARVAGKVAFIDRGVVPFAKKIERAQAAGAIGVVVANNQPGAPLAMGGDGKFDIPAIMITKDLADRLKASLEQGVTIAFKTAERIEKPELIDSITGFSSRGPRSLDALIKPEISAPGSLVISAKMAGGKEGTQMSGTSMASPHMAGVMALLMQTHPELSTAELKSLAMGTAKTLTAPDKTVYRIGRQGAGRVQVMPAIEAKLVALPVGVSLGEVSVERRKMLRREVSIRNIASQALALDVDFNADLGLSMKGPEQVSLAAGEKKTLTFEFTIDTAKLPNASLELDGLLTFNASGVEALRVPVLAVVNKVSQVKATDLVIHSTSEADAQGAAIDLSLTNGGSNAGDAYLFNLLGQDRRKVDQHHDVNLEKSCDLAMAGYRVVRRSSGAVLQFAVKLYEPVTTWDNCEISILIDGNGDGVADQELVGAKRDHLKGLTGPGFSSILLDAALARETRKQFELDTQAGKEDVNENYLASLLEVSAMFAPMASTIAIVEAPVADLNLRDTGELAVRIATSLQELSAAEADDFLLKDKNSWLPLSVADAGAGYVKMPESVSLAGGEAKVVALEKGAGSEALLVLYPSNRTVVGGLANDAQAQVLQPTYAP